jgi:hypothetical protein
MSLAPVMMFALGFTVMGVAVMSLSVTHNKGAKRTIDKWQSDTLAESAANILYDQIRLQMISDLSYPFVLNDTTVTVPKPDGTTDTVGTYSARLLQDREVQTDVEEHGNKYRKFTYYYTVEGRGKAVGGVESVVRVKFRGEVWRNLVPRFTTSGNPPPEMFSFPVGAIVSNSSINVRSNGGLKVTSPNGNDAHLMAESGISWSPSSGSKSSITSSNYMDIQGYYLVPDGGAYSSTVGTGGMGNPNGIKNYKSPSAPAQGNFPGAAANSVVKLEGDVGLADESTVNGWTAEWDTNSKKSGSNYFSSSVTSSSLPARPDGKIGIQSPAQINGSLNVANGQKIELWPSSKDPRKNIVYVKGNISNLGQLVNHGVTLVFEGKYTDDSDAKYQLEPDPLTFKTIEEVMQKSSLLSMSKANDSIQMSTNSSQTTGIVYSLKGGIRMTGNGSIRGMLLAGGTGANGGVDIRPNGGGQFLINFDPYAATGGDIIVDEESVIDTNFVPGNIARNFTPTKLFNWVSVK